MGVVRHTPLQRGAPWIFTTPTTTCSPSNRSPPNKSLSTMWVNTPRTVEPGILLRMLTSQRYRTLGRMTPGQPLALVLFEGVHHGFD